MAKTVTWKIELDYGFDNRWRWRARPSRSGGVVLATASSEGGYSHKRYRFRFVARLCARMYCQQASRGDGVFEYDVAL